MVLRQVLLVPDSVSSDFTWTGSETISVNARSRCCLVCLTYSMGMLQGQTKSQRYLKTVGPENAGQYACRRLREQ